MRLWRRLLRRLIPKPILSTRLSRDFYETELTQQIRPKWFPEKYQLDSNSEKWFHEWAPHMTLRDPADGCTHGKHKDLPVFHWVCYGTEVYTVNDAMKWNWKCVTSIERLNVLNKSCRCEYLTKKINSVEVWPVHLYFVRFTNSITQRLKHLPASRFSPVEMSPCADEEKSVCSFLLYLWLAAQLWPLLIKLDPPPKLFQS